jgi:hypothetical protein
MAPAGRRFELTIHSRRALTLPSPRVEGFLHYEFSEVT